ncbi:MAG TPA: hypothetical protein VL172_12535 [Kofleriaceae bacterium]|jgi:hypothetical protein|nr:hypothetical protein [Kofleriaceae bacterium]
MRFAGLLASVLLCSVPACKNGGGGDEAAPAAEAPAQGPGAGGAVAGSVAANPPAAAAATVSLDGDGNGTGEAGKWRDSGVYVDGAPVAVMWFGELPVKLQPVWKDEIELLDFKPGDKGPRERHIKIRRYRIAEYLEALGVDLRKVQEIHIYAPSGYPGIISGAELRRVRKDLMFAFGRETTGKPLIYFPGDIKINTTFDHIGAIAVYIDKKAPTFTEDEDLLLDGKSVYGIIPYYGEPLRGGIRVYKDDRLAFTIKRKKLQESLSLATKGPDGELRWNLFQFLEARGVATRDLVAAETVERDLRGVRLDRGALEGAWFTAHPSASGQILLGAEHTPVEALMLYSRPLPPRGK